MRKGNDISIFACGTMVFNSLEAADILKVGGLDVSVIDMHTIKPIDKEAIEKASKSSGLIVTVEEHSIIGGLGSAVSEYLCTLNDKPPLLALGLPDEYGSAGEYRSLLEKSKLIPDQIANSIANRFSSI